MTFCVIPFINITTHARGDVKMCCHAHPDSSSEFARKPDGSRYNISKDDLEEAFNSEAHRKLRLDMLNGIENDTCTRCLNEEKAGLESPRERFNERFKDLKNIEFKEVMPLDIRYADLKLSNLCNLKCRMCSPFSSSQWVSEEWNSVSKVVDDSVHRQLNKNDFIELKNLDWSNEDISTNNLLKIADTVEELYFLGGEPTLIKANLDMIDHVIANGRSKDILLKIISNVTNLPKDLLSKFTHFKKVEVLCSIDAKGSLLRYIRYPATWDLVLKNLNKLKAMDNVYTQIDCTVTNYSIHRLDEFLEWYQTQEGVGLYLNILHWPRWLNIHSLPAEMKKDIAKRLKKYPEANKVVTFMLDQDKYEEDFPEFISYTKNLDESRNQNILDEIPEYAKYMDR